MAMQPWAFADPFIPGTLVRADAVNFLFEGIETALQSTQEYLLGNLLRLPESFSGNAEIPDTILTETFIWIDANGDVALYPLSNITQFVDAAASSAQTATQKATLATQQATLAGDYRQQAQDALSGAVQQVGLATAQVAIAAGHAETAGLRANAPENQPLPDGGFSAFHWSEKVRKTAQIFDVDVVQERLDEIELLALAGL